MDDYCIESQPIAAVERAEGILGDITFIIVALGSCYEGQLGELNCRVKPKDVPGL